MTADTPAEYERLELLSDEELIEEYVDDPKGEGAERVREVLAFRRHLAQRDQNRLQNIQNYVLVVVAIGSMAAAWSSYWTQVDSLERSTDLNSKIYQIESRVDDWDSRLLALTEWNWNQRGLACVAVPSATDLPP